MKKYFVVIILLLGSNVILQPQNREPEKHSYSDFEKQLNPNMGNDSIVTRFGNPNTTTGSGLHILIYELVDSTSLIIGCTNISIIYAKHYDRNGNLIHELINKSGYTNQPHKKKVKKPKHQVSICNWRSAPQELSG